MCRLVITSLVIFVGISGSSAHHVKILPTATTFKVGKVLQGVLPCGSQSKIVEVRDSDCSVLPCDRTKGKNYTIQIDFIPSKSQEKFHILLSAISLSSRRESVILDEDISTPAEAGTSYTLLLQWTVPQGSSLGFVAPILQLTGLSGEKKVMEVCGLGMSRIVD